MCAKNSVLGFLTGLSCGVGIALLLAPKSGEETRKMIADQAREGVDRVKQQATDLRNSANEVLEKGQQAIQRRKDGIKNAVEAGTQAYQSAV